MTQRSGSSAASEPAQDDPDYVPTRQEMAAAQRILDRRDRRPPAPRFKVEIEDGCTSIKVDHADKGAGHLLLTDSLAASTTAFVGGLLTQMAKVARRGKRVTADELNFVLAVVHEIGPRDPTEALLAVQMAAIHNATMTAANQLNHVETLDQQNSASNMLNKLARTFAGQVETLKRYRSSGEQSVRVTHQHVNVTAGQAVVGITGGGGKHESHGQSHGPTRGGQPGSPLLGHEQAHPMPLQGAGDARASRVPVPRCASRGSKREG